MINGVDEGSPTHGEAETPEETHNAAGHLRGACDRREEEKEVGGGEKMESRKRMGRGRRRD